MELLESVKTTLTELVESAGENITEGKVVSEIVKRHRIGYYEAVEAVKSVYQDVGLIRTPEHTGKVITYKTKQQERPEEPAAVRMARNSANRTAGEKQRQEIIRQYRR